MNDHNLYAGYGAQGQEHPAIAEVAKLIEENKRLRLTVAAQKAIIDMQARETGESAPIYVNEQDEARLRRAGML
jgi:hypothetical protein